MFEGQKTSVFWLGLIILGLASFDLFSILWYQVVNIDPWYYYIGLLRYMVPHVVGAVLFILTGLYMMKSGAKKEKREQQLQQSTTMESK
jgi:uncharacterized membrane protein